MKLPTKRKADEQWDGVLCVPFAQKDAAKALGARWDCLQRVWVVPPDLRGRRCDFEAWDKQAPPAPELQLKRERITSELARALRACDPPS